jgi:4-amino-4-deoxy-L-arabinose transferase-like glycosyltransferase
MDAVLFRPLLPIDETRYMSVAWEMLLHHGWFQPLTMNFAPYHHKPPLLFWMINLFWGMFGVSRWAAAIPLALSALASVILTGILGRALFPGFAKDEARLHLIMMACVPFLIYSTLVMFDVTLTVFVLLALISLKTYAVKRRWCDAVLIGLFLGLGVLTKGPVAYLYVLFPLLLAPLWERNFNGAPAWYAGCTLVLAVSALVVLAWLIPVLLHSDSNFAFWLVWNQTAGRVTGNFSDAHNRPFYFYLPLLPVMIMPWIFFPAFWRSAKNLKIRVFEEEGVRFLLTWLIPVFLCFSLISGKQPHYLVPLLPGIALLLALYLRELRTKTIAVTFLAMLAAITAGQVIAAKVFFNSYDLDSAARYVQEHPDADWAYVSNYHAELGFLARLEKPIADIERNKLDRWFAQHPAGLAVILYKRTSYISGYKILLDIPYRGARLAIVSFKNK